MGEPLSIAGLTLQIASVLKHLYDYGKEVKSAQKDIINLYSELSALKSALCDLQAQHELCSLETNHVEFNKMFLMTKTVLDGLLQRLEQPSTPSRQAVQRFRWPFDKASMRDVLVKLERIKSWLLMVLMTDGQKVTRALHDDLRALTSLVQEDIAKRKLHGNAEARKRLYRKLTPVDHTVAHNRACKAWHGTSSGDWFIDGPFSSWVANRDVNNRVLMLSGKSGAGKTTLISRAIERAKDYANAGTGAHIAYCYCAYNDAASQEVRNILGTWAVQAANKDPAILSRFTTSLEDQREIQASDIAKSLMDFNGPLILFLDAVNESLELTKLVNMVNRVTEEAHNIKCVLTSTSPSLYPFQCLLVEMRPELVSQDIEAYIKRQIEENQILRTIPESEVIGTLLNKADGMFRWVDCQMNLLAAQWTAKMVRKTLNSLPGSLNESYATILSHVPKTDEKLVKEALLWLSFSSRPLTLQELCEAVVVEEGDHTIDVDCRLDPNERLVDLCRGLAVWDKAADTVSLAHSSIRSFLVGPDIMSARCATYALDEQVSTLGILRTCLTYLLMKDFSAGMCRPSGIRSFLEDFPLLDYASSMWALHASRYQLRLSTLELGLIDSLMHTHLARGVASNFSLWISCLTPSASEFVIAKAQPLYYMASYSLDLYVQRMFRKGLVNKVSREHPWYIDWKCGRAISTALQVACHRASLSTVKVLLEQGADPNTTCFFGYSCLLIVLVRGDHAIYRLMQQYGARLNECDKKYPELWTGPAQNMLYADCCSIKARD